MFKDKVLLITGGTGSFGNAVLRRFVSLDIKEIRIFSRDEKKQDNMRYKYADDRLKFYIGDVRDYDSIMNAMRGVDYVFHSAALKQVPSCEFHPIEAVKTNIIGTENVLTAAINAEVKHVIGLSTDKAVYPINAMGTSKAMMEKVLIAKSRQGGNKSVISGSRYGNVMASRGSVFPLLVVLINEVLFAFNNGAPGDIFVQKAPAVTIGDMTKALCELMGKSNYPTRVIGTRHGEKKCESLLSREEMACALDMGSYYKIPPDLRDLNYAKYVDIGEESITDAKEYNSDNTERLDVEGMKLLLNKLKFIQAASKGKIIDPEE